MTLIHDIRLCNGRKPLNSSGGGSPSIGWRPINPYCIIDDRGNTGQKGYRTLQMYDTVTGGGLGVTKPNEAGRPDYVAPVSDSATCPVAQWVELIPDTLDIGSAEYQFTLSVQTSTSWTVSNFSPGLSFSKINGSGNDTINVIVAENSDTFEITKSFSVVTPDGTAAVVNITQGAYDPTQLIVSPTSLSFTPSGGSQDLVVQASQTWDFSDNMGWASVSRSGNTLTVIANNNTGGARHGTVKIVAQLTTVNVSVSQSAVPTYTVSLYGRGTTIDQFSGAVNPDEAMNNTIQKTIYSTSPVDQIGVGTMFYMDSQMLTPVPGEAMWYRLGNTTIAIQIDLGGYYLDMVDTGITLEISPQSSNVGAGGGTRVINISSNTDWNNYAKPAWITNVNPSLGTGNQSVTITIAQNDAQTPRTGNVSFRTGNQQRTAVFQVQQQGYSPISPTNVSIPKSGGFFSITITTAGAWSVQTPLPSEISIPSGQLSGSGDALISVSVDPNPFNNDRLITIVLMVGGVNHFVDIQQAGTDV